MLVGNKLDMESARKTPRAMGEQFAQEEGLLFTEASAKTGDGVEELFAEIGEFAVHMNDPPMYSLSERLCSLHSLQPRSSL